MKWLVLLGLVACSNDTLAPNELCDAMITMQCTRFYQCHTAQEIADAGMPATLAACIDSLRPAANCDAAVASTYCASGTVYQEKGAFTCIDEGNAAECDQFITIEDSVTLTSLMTITTDCAKVCMVPTT
ncbi:MAG: hypothetical protein QM831_23480 [Kofleriaceae bacterium]